MRLVQGHLFEVCEKLSGTDLNLCQGRRHLSRWTARLLQVTQTEICKVTNLLIRLLVTYFTQECQDVLKQQAVSCFVYFYIVYMPIAQSNAIHCLRFGPILKILCLVTVKIWICITRHCFNHKVPQPCCSSLADPDHKSKRQQEYYNCYCIYRPQL